MVVMQVAIQSFRRQKRCNMLTNLVSIKPIYFVEEKEKRNRNHLQAITKDTAIRLKIWIDLSNFWMEIRILELKRYYY